MMHYKKNIAAQEIKKLVKLLRVSHEHDFKKSKAKRCISRTRNY